MDPQTPPKYSVSEFARLVRAKYPGAYDAMPDDELAKKVAEKYPDYANQIEWQAQPQAQVPAPISSLVDKVMATGLRVVPPIAGGIIGSLVATPGLGTAAGGALGGGAGEFLAEEYEKLRGLRQEVSVPEIAIGAGIGAIPIKAPGGAGILKTALIHGAQGAGISSGAEAAREVFAEGHAPELGRVGQAAVMGGVLGGGFGGAVRAFRGTPVVPRPAFPPRLEAILAEQAQTGKAKAPSGLGFATKYLESLTPAKRMVNEVASRVPMSIEENPITTMDLVRGGIGGRIQNAFSDYKAIVNEAEQANLLPALRAHLNLTGYDSALKVLESKAPQDAEIARRLAQGQALPKNYNQTSLAADRAAFNASLTPEQLTQVQGLGQRVFDLNRRALDLAHTSGIVSDPVYTSLVGRGSEYVPMTRIMDDTLDQAQAFRMGGLSLKQQHVLQNLEGSARVNVDPIEASMQRYQQVVKESGRNDAARAFLSLREKNPEVFGELVKPLPPNAKPPAGYGTIGFYEQGVAQRFLVPQAVADAMSFVTPADADLLGGTILRATRRYLQAGATAKNLYFLFRNPIRDISDLRTLAKGQSPFNPVDFASTLKTWVQSLKDVAQQSPTYRAAGEAGALYGTLQKSITPSYFLYGREAPQTFFQKAVRPGLLIFDKIADLNNLAEETTKITAWKRLKAAGFSDAAAAIETRRFGGSPDFASRGASEGMNLAFMFLSPEIRGTLRTFEGLSRDPLRAMKVLAGTTGAILAQREWNSRFINPDDGKPEIDHIPQPERTNYNILLLPYSYKDSQGRSHFWRLQIPRGYTQQMIHSAIDGTLDSLAGKTSPLQTVLDTASQILPGQTQIKSESLIPSTVQRAASMLNPGLRVPGELLAGKAFYSNTPIEPARVAAGLSIESATARTSPALKAVMDYVNASKIPQALGVEVRAPYVQHIIEQMTPGPGRMALDVADLATQPLPQGLTGVEKLTRLPIAGGIFRTFLGGTGDQVERDLLDRFYSALAKSGQTQTSLTQLAREHPERANALLSQPDTLNQLATFSALSGIAKQLAQVEQAQRMLTPGQSQSDLHQMKMRLLQASVPFLRGK